MIILLLRLIEGKTKVRVGADDYQIRVGIHDSFGEDAFRVSFKRLKSA